MLFNFGKCKCLHTGHGNLDFNNKIGDTVLRTTVKEIISELRDLSYEERLIECGLITI